MNDYERLEKRISKLEKDTMANTMTLFIVVVTDFIFTILKMVK